MSWNNTFTYRNLSLSFLIDSRFGGDVLSQTQADMDMFGVTQVTADARNAGFVMLEGNRIEDVKGFYKNEVGGRAGVTEYYMYDATNIRLRNITLGYTFNRAMLKKTPFQRLNLSATCNNVWMIHYNLPGIDPESVSATNTNATGFENGAAPTSRSFTFNVTVGF